MQNGAKYLVFPDGGEWIVFAPVSHLVMRVNSAAAQQFEGMIDRGANLGHGKDVDAPENADDFPPSHMTVVCTNMCGQKCVYCYGTPAHANGSTINPDFCRAAARLAAKKSAERGQTLRVFFHGVGEPTCVWSLFQECVGIVEEEGAKLGIGTYCRLCTGGQVDQEQAEWLAQHINELDLSLDGPRDIQNAQRPRLDGKDSFDLPLNLARVFVRTGKSLVIKVTVTQATVPRMTEIVEFVAKEIGRATIHFGMMFRTPWADRRVARSPGRTDYVEQFGAAIDLGARLGIRVQHPTISYESLCSPSTTSVKSHFCLAPPNIVTASFDIPEEGSGDPQQGAYGWYDSTDGSLRFDHEKRQRLEQQQTLLECVSCPCGSACLGAAGVKGRVPKEISVSGPICQARIGVMKELLRRVSPRRLTAKEVST